MKKILIYIFFFLLFTTISAESPEENESFDLYFMSPRTDFFITFQQSNFYIENDAFGYINFGTYKIDHDTIITHQILEFSPHHANINFTDYKASPVYDTYLISSDSVITYYPQIPESWIEDYNNPETDEMTKAAITTVMSFKEADRERRIQYVKAVPIKE
ncbi:MAG: hypothetical protein K2M00_05640 [Muribaculaceae bacterium]|nr:hypothetical protein [Muribaculaceae bacterium]